MFIPVCEPIFEGNEKKYLLQAFQSGWISSQGKFLDRFEKEFARYIGVRYAVTVTSGTAALHLAMTAAGIGPNDEVIMPDFTMIACASAIHQCGARPILIDVDPETWTLDWKQVEKKITRQTKAILAVHMYGHPVDMTPLKAIASRHRLIVIEDAAEAFGARYKGDKCGALSDIAAFSFYANKILTTGEGGMVVTNSKKHYDACRSYKNLCFPLTGARSYRHEDMGFNYRMTNLQAAVGVAQLENADLLVRKRRQMGQRYLKHLRDFPLIQTPAQKPGSENVYWMFGIVLKEKCKRSRNSLITALRKAGIDSRPFFTPMHRQPALLKHGYRDSSSFPVSDMLGDRGLYLPSSGHLREDQIDFICQTLRTLLA